MPAPLKTEAAVNFTAVEAAASKLALRYQSSADSAMYPSMCERYAKRARDLRHIALDASAAGEIDDPCLVSANSVLNWLHDDHELCVAAESYVPAMGSN